MSPIPYLIAIAIIGIRVYEAYQHAPHHHVVVGPLLPSAVGLLVVATVFSLLAGWIGRRRQSRRRSSRYSSSGSSYRSYF